MLPGSGGGSLYRRDQNLGQLAYMQGTELTPYATYHNIIIKDFRK